MKEQCQKRRKAKRDKGGIEKERMKHEINERKNINEVIKKNMIKLRNKDK